MNNTTLITEVYLHLISNSCLAVCVNVEINCHLLLTNDQVRLNGLGVRLIHLRFLSSSIYPHSQHSLPVVFVFLLSVSINKILWVTLVPLLSSPVFMCVFTCECARCCCVWEVLCLRSCCVSSLSSAHQDPAGVQLSSVVGCVSHEMDL